MSEEFIRRMAMVAEIVEKYKHLLIDDTMERYFVHATPTEKEKTNCPIVPERCFCDQESCMSCAYTPNTYATNQKNWRDLV